MILCSIMKERNEEWINSLYMYKKGQTSMHLTDDDDGNQPLPHIYSAFDNPAGWWIFCVTWSQQVEGLTSSRQTSSLPPSPRFSLSLHILSNHCPHEVNRLLEPQRWWNVAVIGSSSEPKLWSSQEVYWMLQLTRINVSSHLWSCTSSFIPSLLLFPLSFSSLLL